ncbi:MAG: hypothetical protein F4Z55_12930 [Boseongicola sp. SB0667_bin_21]|nr:hypothetical protein [Boseongicola sp. SB0667_bin_21]
MSPRPSSYSSAIHDAANRYQHLHAAEELRIRLPVESGRERACRDRKSAGSDFLHCPGNPAIRATDNPIRPRTCRRDWTRSGNYSYRRNMNRAETAATGTSIGSEAADSTKRNPITQSVKRSDMKWRRAGRQAVTALRISALSDRFDRAWDMLMDRRAYLN